MFEWTRKRVNLDLSLGVTLSNTFYGQSTCRLVVYLYFRNNSNLSLMSSVLFSPQTPPPEPDQSALWRRCHSQFTDVDDYRRHGRNTWHDESGVYANSALRDEVIKPTNPIPERLA